VIVNRSGDDTDVRLPIEALALGTGEGLYPVLSTAGDPGSLRVDVDGTDRVAIRMPALSGAVLLHTGIE